MQSIQALTGAQTKFGIAVFVGQKPAALRRAKAKRAGLEATAQQEITNPGSQLGSLNRSKLSMKTLRYIKRRVRETDINTKREAKLSTKKQAKILKLQQLETQIRTLENSLRNASYWERRDLEITISSLEAQAARCY